MIILIVLIFLQIWITTGSGCGDAPNVTLNCEDDGFAHVNWTLSDPHCHFDCKAKWICRDAVNASNIHREESGLGCASNWTFNATWDYYFCNVSVYYEYYNGRLYGNVESPTTIKSCENFRIDYKPKIQSITENPVVGYFYEIQCIVEEHISFVSFNWIGPDGAAIVNNSRINITNTIIGNNHTSILQFEYLKETDNGSYNCNVAIQNNIFSTESFMLKDFKIPTPNVSVTATNNHPTIGESFSMECNVTVTKGIIGNVEITWAVNGTVKRRVTDTVEANDSQYVLHRDVYNIPRLHASNNNTVYCCKAVINAREHVESNSSITLTIVSDAVSNKMVTVSPTSTDMITVAPASKCKDRSLDHVAVIISSIVAVILVMLIAFLLGYCTYKMLIRRRKKLNFTKQEDDDTAVSTI